MDKTEIDFRHPRAKSLQIRNRLTKGFEEGITSAFGLFAHGRGEAFDYLLGEQTTENASRAMHVAAAMLLQAKHPVLSVNGNVAALVPNELVQLSGVTEAKIEVNLYHRSVKREERIAQTLQEAGAKEILGIEQSYSTTIPEIYSERRRVDQRGLLKADVVFVPLEDGDRTEALVKLGKQVITVDLNPLSRTAQMASITIVDNIVRALPTLVNYAKELKKHSDKPLIEMITDFDNQKNLSEAIQLINHRLSNLAKSRSEIHRRTTK